MTLGSDNSKDDSDVRAWFEQTTPQRIPVDVDRLLVETQSASSPRRHEHQSRSNRWRKLMTRRSFVGVAGLATCAFFGTLGWQLFAQPDLAFSQVKERVEATESVQYFRSHTSNGKDFFASQNEKILVEARHRLREIEKQLEATTGEKKDHLIEEQSDLKRQIDFGTPKKSNPLTQKVMVLGRHRERVESPTEMGQRIGITNARTGKSISIDPVKKTVMVFTKQVSIDEETGAISEEKIRPNPEVDFYSSMRDVPADAAKLKETLTIDGVKLIGFQTVEPDGTDTWTRTFWVDPKTKLPRQINVKHRSTNPRHSPSDWVLSKIEFDVALDEELFSTEPPEGYEVRESKIMGIVPSKK